MYTFVCHSAQQSPSGKQGVPEGRRVLSGEMAPGFLQPPCPVGSVAPGTRLPLHSFWVARASCWGGLYHSAGSRSWDWCYFSTLISSKLKAETVFRLLLKTSG